MFRSNRNAFGLRNYRRISMNCGVVFVCLLAASSLSAQSQSTASPDAQTQSQTSSPSPSPAPASQPISPSAINRANLLAQFNDSLEELTSRVSPSIVQVQVTGYRSIEAKDESETSLIGRERSLGSGVIVDPDGYIVTNAHVVKGAQRIRVVVSTRPTGDSDRK